MEKEANEPYPPLSHWDTRRKETHLHRAKGNSRLFDGTAWYLQSGVTISGAAVARKRTNPMPAEGDDEEPRLLVGTQTLKRSGFTRSPRAKKRLKDIAPEDVEMQSSSSSEAEDSNSDVGMSPSAKRKQKQATKVRGKKKPRKSDGWIWLESLTSGRNLGDDKMAEYKRESDRVQWFRAEAEMYRWLEQYERKHAELMRVIKRYRRDGEVWARIGDREEERNGGVNGAVAFARMQAAMFKRLEHNANVIFKSAESGAHHDWASAATFDELVIKIDGWRDVVFKWMDDMTFIMCPGATAHAQKVWATVKFLSSRGLKNRIRDSSRECFKGAPPACCAAFARMCTELKVWATVKFLSSRGLKNRIGDSSRESEYASSLVWFSNTRKWHRGIFSKSDFRTEVFAVEQQSSSDPAVNSIWLAGIPAVLHLSMSNPRARSRITEPGRGWAAP
ncbi:hypothetical protein DFH09DRAFT_1100440 [Mycena vulgaris]|nr:hypothetical protein DFH09DRAFT_1100440 [Mycena vulgaris]